MTATDWLWWGPAGLLALAGVALLGRALFADRARGRRRCPKCWYELGPEPARQCPECGRVARSERAMHRTRRHWWRAMLGVVMLAGTAALAGGRQVEKHGWIGAVPSAAYILALPRLDPTTYKELERRVATGELRPWEYRLLVHRSLGVLASSDDPALLTSLLGLLERVERIGRSAAEEIDPRLAPPGTWARISEIDRETAIETFLALMSHRDGNLRERARFALSSFGENGRVAVPALIGQMADGDEDANTISYTVANLVGEDRDTLTWPAEMFGAWHDTGHERTRDFLERLRRCGTDTRAALPVFLDGLDLADDGPRAASVFGATVCGAGRPEVRARILAGYEDAAIVVRTVVVSATSAFPMEPAVEDVLRRALADTSRVAVEAARSIEHHGAAAAGLRGDVEALLLSDDTDADMAPWLARAYAATGGSPDVAAHAMLDACAPSGELAYALFVIGKNVGNAPGARDRISKHLRHEYPDVRAAAALAYAVCGGDRRSSTREVLTLLAAGHGSVNTPYMELIRRDLLSVPEIVAWLDRPDPAQRTLAVGVLRQLWCREALPELRDRLDDPDPGVRQFIVESISHIENAPLAR